MCQRTHQFDQMPIIGWMLDAVREDRRPLICHGVLRHLIHQEIWRSARDEHQQGKATLPFQQTEPGPQVQEWELYNLGEKYGRVDAVDEEEINLDLFASALSSTCIVH